VTNPIIRTIRFGASLVACLAVGLTGLYFTSLPTAPDWFAALEKPVFMPPTWVFYWIWVILYLLMGISLYLVWSKGLGHRHVQGALSIFGVQMVLNVLWWFFFFGLQDPYLAFIEVIILGAALFMTIILVDGVSRPAAFLLAPSLLWVSFVALLSSTISYLNP